mmetsp:Transcript_5132/g.17912  ORF Transcript_5132/g.17912 Transcript_5132/m.17912 type:complete len:209 (-) Transcript_5132:395-1021(-)
MMSASWNTRFIMSLIDGDGPEGWNRRSVAVNGLRSTSLVTAALTSSKLSLSVRLLLISSWLRIRRMSLLQSSTSASIAASLHCRPSSCAISIMRLRTDILLGLVKGISVTWLRRLLSFWLYTSLHMHTMGTFVPLMVSMRSATPPRSPADMPSTSSITRHTLRSPPPKDTARFVTISFTRLVRLPATPPFTSLSALPRASLAFTSTTS